MNLMEHVKPILRRCMIEYLSKGENVPHEVTAQFLMIVGILLEENVDELGKLIHNINEKGYIYDLEVLVGFQGRPNLLELWEIIKSVGLYVASAHGAFSYGLDGYKKAYEDIKLKATMSDLRPKKKLLDNEASPVLSSPN